MREFWSKLWRSLSGRKGLANDLADEVESSLDLATADNIAAGMDPVSARAAALQRFGNPTLIAEEARDTWSFLSLETLLRDLRFGLRGIRRAPGFSAVIVLTLALGIGANTAIFSVVDAVLLKPLPYPNPDRLVWLGESVPQAEGISVSWINYRNWQKYNRSFEDMAGFEQRHMTLTGRGEPLLTTGATVTGHFFDILGARPLLGRTFTAQEDSTGADRAVVLDHSFWTGKLGGDPAILGNVLVLNGQPYRVVGVLAPGLKFFSRTMDYYLPLGSFRSDALPRSGHGSMRLVARLRPGVLLQAARADLDGIMQRLAKEDPGPENSHRAYAHFLAEQSTGSVRPTLLLLMSAVGLVLLIACANVASLVLARNATRGREMAIRAAIGAGRKRLIRQLLTESLLIAAVGGVFGLLLAQWCLRVLINAAPKGIPRLQETVLDSQVMLFAIVLTVLAGLLVGLAPIFAAGKIDLAASLASGGRSATVAKKEQWFRNSLVVGEIAITLVLAFTSGLLLRSLITAQNSNPGFNADHLLALELILPSSSYRSPQSVQEFYDRLAEDLRTLPGVASVGKVNCPPAAGLCKDWFYSVSGAPVPSQNDVPIAVFNIADPDYFRSMKMPLLEGRDFASTDRTGGPDVAVVNELFARTWWPGKPAIGHRVKEGGPYMDGPTHEIVGVVGNVSQDGLDEKPKPEIYLSFAQVTSQAMVLMIRSTGDQKMLLPAVRRSVALLDRNLPIQRLARFEDTLAATLDRRRFGTILLAAFAGLAMLLSAVGVYGLLSYWVTAREEEIAIRMALGAQRSSIFTWAGSQASKLVLLGIALGLLAGWSASRWLDALVFGISARDSEMMTIAALLVVAIASLAAAIPLLRATRVDVASLQRS